MKTPLGDLDRPADQLEVALAWHDLTCPEAEECRSRHVHAISNTLANTGLLGQFFDRMITNRKAHLDG